MGFLLAEGLSSCELSTNNISIIDMTKVVFDNIESNIVNQLMLAQKSIKVAVAWINSKEILGILCWKLKGGVDVVLILQYDDINNGGINSLDLVSIRNLEVNCTG